MQPPRSEESYSTATPATSRRSLLRRGGVLAAAGALPVALSACAEDDPGAPKGVGGMDIAILNFALTLEFLERDFYDKVYAEAGFTGRDRALLETIRDDEREHVNSLRAAIKALGGTVVKRPDVRLDKLMEGGRDGILRTAADLENTGAAAYLGQAPFIQDEGLLATALAIHTVEARHAAVLNMMIGRSIVPNGAFATPLTRGEVLSAVAPFIA